MSQKSKDFTCLPQYYGALGKIVKTVIFFTIIVNIVVFFSIQDQFLKSLAVPGVVCEDIQRLPIRAKETRVPGRGLWACSRRPRVH